MALSAAGSAATNAGAIISVHKNSPTGFMGNQHIAQLRWRGRPACAPCSWQVGDVGDLPHATSLSGRFRQPANWVARTSYPGTTSCPDTDRKSTRLNSSHLGISYAVFCLKKKNIK